MSQTTILHLSDLHIKCEEKNVFDQDIVLSPLIERVVRDMNKGLCPEVVIITGDISFQGKKEEFELAAAFLKRLMENIKLSEERLFIVPGNHDVNRLAYRPSDIPNFQSMRQLNDELENTDFRAELLKGQKPYFDFIQMHFPHLISLEKGLVPFVQAYETSSKNRLGLIGLNSAWMSRRSPDQGTIAIGEYQLRKAINYFEEQDKIDLKLACFHHPISWLWEKDRPIVRKYLQNFIVFSGHLHDAGGGFIQDADGKIFQFSAGALYLGSDSQFSMGYHYLTIDWDQNSLILDYRTFTEKKHQWILDSNLGDDGKQVLQMPRRNLRPKDSALATISSLEAKLESISKKKIPEALYLKGVELKNIRCFEELNVSFEEKAKPVSWAMVLGDNASGKSTFLRAIALGLCNESEAVALLNEIPGFFIRNGRQEGLIRLHLYATDVQDTFSITTTLKRKKDTKEESIRKKYQPESFPWGSVFVCGYGCKRNTYFTKTYDRYSPFSALETLFDYQKELQNPEVILQRNREHFNEIEKKMLDILRLKKSQYRILLEKQGFFIEGPWGKVPFDSLSDGFRSTMIWVADLIGWLTFTERFVGENLTQGIVLLDELEQHLHPKWQRHIVRELHEKFPGIQFIVSTHTPLTASGMCDIDSALIFRFEKNSIKEVPLYEIRNFRADQVLTSNAFGLITSRSPGSQDDVTRFIELAQKKRSEDEEREFLDLEKEIQEKISFGESPFEQMVEKAVSKTLEVMLKNEPEALHSIEIKRQLTDLFT